MFSTIRRAGLAAVAAVGVLGGAVPVDAAPLGPVGRPGGPVAGRPVGGRLDRMAVRLEGQLRQLHEEVDQHVRRTPAAGHLHQDVVGMQRAASRLHDAVHRGISPFRLRGELRELDRMQHHVEDVLDRMIARRELSPVGASHIRQSLTRVGRTIHRMQDEVR